MWSANHLLLALRGGEGWPVTASELGAPLGGHFVSPSPLFDAISAALRLVLGPVATFNALVLAHLGLALGGAWTLARLGGASWEGRLVAATVFGFNAQLLSAGVASGAPEGLAMAWIPWALSATIWLARRPGPLPALSTALALTAMSLADLHLALFAPLLLPIVLLPELGVGAREALAGRSPGRLLWIALGVGAGVLGAVSLIAPLVPVLAAPDLLAPPGSPRLAALPDPSRLGGLASVTATLSGVLLPGGALIQEQGAALGALCLYAGWVAIALALVGAGLGRLRWVALALVALVVAMGPYLLVTPDGGRPVPVPWWRWARELWPVTRLLGSPVRALGFGWIGLAVLAAAGTEKLLAALPSVPRARAALPWALSAAVLAEILTLSPLPARFPTASVWIPGAEARLRELPGTGAVLDWPQREPGGGTEISRYLAYQMWHGRRIFADPRTGPGGAGVEANPFFAALERATYGDAYRSSEWSRVSDLPAASGVAALRAMGFEWLVYHPWHVSPDRQEALASWLTQNLQLEVQEPDGSRIYAMRSPGVPGR